MGIVRWLARIAADVRLDDLRDWWVLRRRLRRPWEFLCLRKRPPATPYYDVLFRDGIRVRLRSVPMDRHIFHRVFARDEYRLEGIAPGSWDTVIDVGAHIGIFAIRAAPLARRILSYEPDPENHGLLCRNAEPFPQIRAFRRAVAARQGTVTLYRSDNPSAHSTHPPWPREGGVAVEAVTLGEVFREHAIERCDLLKLDCEGAEYEILGAVPVELWRRIRRVALEYHPVAGGAPQWTGERLAEFLQGVGHAARLFPSKKDPCKGLLFSSRVD